MTGGHGLSGLSLRARLMLIGVTGVALALVVGGIVLYRVLVFSVDRTLDVEAMGTATEVATLVRADRLPSPLPVSGAQLVQVVDAEGRVVAGSVSADKLVALLRPAELARALAGEAVLVRDARAGMSGPLRVRALAVGPERPGTSVIVALQVGDVLTSRAALRRSLLVVIPLLVLGLGLIAWRVVGWTLRPVEALRLDAERVRGRDRQERLPVPRAADEIRALAVTLNDMLDRLSAARTRQQSFVADAAHELRSPLTSMRTQLEVAQHLGEGGTLPAELLVDVARLSALVEDLLLLARADADRRGPADPSLVDAGALLREVAAGYAGARVPVEYEDGGGVGPSTRSGSGVAGPSTGSGSGVAGPSTGSGSGGVGPSTGSGSGVVGPSTGSGSGGVVVLADPEELRRAVANLVDNAVRHAAARVRLRVDLDGSDVLLSVLDDGPGLAPPDRERVFERFTRLDEARDRDAGGSGLGLAIVRELVHRAGGTVTLGPVGPDGEPERPGLRATIRLPLSVESTVGNPVSTPASRP